jgi:outer membrane protein OmpA-like peptidoglycan-associated protein
MTELTKANVGELLQQANLSSYILSMGKSVAEAQAALDANSIAQLPQFTAPMDTLGGKSLIQMGLLPTFYHFTKATLSASLSLSLKVSESFDIGGELSLNTDSKTTKKVDKTSYKYKSLTKEVVLSDTAKFESAAWNASGSALEKIHSYSGEQTIEGKTHYVIAERAAVEGATSISTTGLVAFNAEAAIFAVPPAGKDWQVWKITGADTADAKAKAQAFANTMSDHEDVYYLGPDNEVIDGNEPKDLASIFFPFDGRAIAPKSDDTNKLRAVAHIAKKVGKPVKLTGHADAVGEVGYNDKLALDRAKAVAAGIDSFAIALGLGETMATVPEAASNSARKTDRRVDIDCGVPINTYYVFARKGDNNWPSATLPSGVTLEDSGSYSPADDSITGLVSAANLTTAVQVASAFSTNAAYEASAVGELVYLTNKSGKEKDVFTLSIYDEAGELVTFSQESSSEDKTLTQSGSGTVTDVLKDKISSAAFAATVDGRYARSYDMSMSGNMSISAEMVAVPPPQAFLNFVAGEGE